MCKWLCICGYDIVRSIPYLTILGVAATGVGAVLALTQKHAIVTVVSDLGLSQLESGYIHYLWLIYLITLLVNAIVLILSFLVSGKIRECCFDTSHDSGCWGCMQIFMGPVVQFLLFLALCATFVIQIPVLWALTSIGGILTLISGACLAGEGEMKDLGKMLIHSGLTSASAHSIKQDAGEVAADALQDLHKALNEFCALPDRSTWASAVIVAGTIVCLIAQSELLVFTYANFMRVWHTMIQDPEEADEKKPLL